MVMVYGRFCSYYMDQQQATPSGGYCRVGENWEMLDPTTARYMGPTNLWEMKYMCNTW